MKKEIKKVTTFKQWFRVACCGTFMGAADIVPGISGGTIAFILGIYDQFLDSIKSLNLKTISHFFCFRFKLFFQLVEWEFLSALLMGMIFSFITLAHFFNYTLQHEVYRQYLYGGFLGLICAAIILCFKQITSWKSSFLVLMLLGAFITFQFTGTTIVSNPHEKLYHVELPEKYWKEFSKPIENYDSTRNILKNVSKSTLSAMFAKRMLNENSQIFDQALQPIGSAKELTQTLSSIDKMNWSIVGCGILAISAMLLPGISGSYLLTIIGVYPLLIQSLTDFMTGLKNFNLDEDSFFVLFSFVIGCVLGALAFSWVVSYLLKKYHQAMIALMTGLMIGALKTVWPFYTYNYELLPLKLEKGPQLIPVAPFLPEFSSTILWMTGLYALGGFFLLVIIENLSITQKEDKEILL